MSASVPTFAKAQRWANRLSTITLNNDPSPDFTFGYDALSRRTSLARANGITTTYGYTPQSWVNSILHKNSAGTVLDGATYTYDNAGNRKTRVDKRLGTTLTFGYDNIYQLLSAKQGSTTKESYSYDIVGNRLSSLGVSPYTYNSSNELVSLPSGSYGYDNNGNTKTKPDGTQYNWDFDNRLTQVILPGSGGTVNFKYDPFGRRIQKAFTQGSTTTTTNYLYDGMNAIEEVDNTGGVLARYTQGGLDEELSQLRSGTTSYYLQDALGSVTSLSNGAGSLANTYTYDSFGKLAASTGTITNPFQYTGRDFDNETGIYYNRARYYDQNIGRFLSEDKIGFSGGVNFYSYTYNSPIGFKDPTGLAPCNPAQSSVCSSKCRSAGMAFESCSLHRLDLGVIAFQWTWCSCQSPFGKCSGIRHATLQGAVDIWCKSGASACSPSMSCAELANNMNRNAACAAARECINGECYGGGDPGHQEAAANARAAAQKCLLYMMMKGCK